MTSEQEILAAAQDLVNRHGRGAKIEAAKRLEDLLISGDVEGCSIWQRIIRAIEDLERKMSEPDGSMH